MRRTLVLGAVLTVVVTATGIGVAATSAPGAGGHHGDHGDHGDHGRFHVLRVERNGGRTYPSISTIQAQQVR
jgi:Spy/CpxP family protein refolding chaperone